MYQRQNMVVPSKMCLSLQNVEPRENMTAGGQPQYCFDQAASSVAHPLSLDLPSSWMAPAPTTQMPPYTTVPIHQPIALPRAASDPHEVSALQKDWGRPRRGRSSKVNFEQGLASERCDRCPGIDKDREGSATTPKVNKST